jgi:intraflagellar transport protein 88
MERKVQHLLHESARLSLKKDFAKSLQTAKEAKSCERELFRYIEIHCLNEQTMNDLPFASSLNLAISFQESEMLDDAIETYFIMIKEKEHPNAERLRVNIGNILYQQGKYRDAIKMYRMVLDQIPSTEREIGFKISLNIGKAFLKMGQYREAVQHFEAIMASSPSHEVGFNLVLCYFTIYDKERIRRGFSKLSSIPLLNPVFGIGDDALLINDLKTEEVCSQDSLNQLIETKVKDANCFLFTAARIIAPAVVSNTWVSGYSWAVDQVYKKGNVSVVCQLEMEQALEHLRKNEISMAFELLKSFERKDQRSKAMAAANLSSAYFLEGDYSVAHSLANTAISYNRFNPLSIVNKGNCLFAEEDYAGAKALYHEAIGVQSGCVVAMFNLGLVNLKLGLVREALFTFEKIHRIDPSFAPAIYHLACINEKTSELKEAIKWHSVLISSNIVDAGVLARIGQLYLNSNDEKQGFCHFLESYKLYPICLNILSWLGSWFLKNEMYEQSLHLFDICGCIQPTESKWPLMISCCYHRMKNYSESHRLYLKILDRDPENVECGFPKQNFDCSSSTSYIFIHLFVSDNMDRPNVARVLVQGCWLPMPTV